MSRRRFPLYSIYKIYSFWLSLYHIYLIGLTPRANGMNLDLPLATTYIYTYFSLTSSLFTGYILTNKMCNILMKLSGFLITTSFSAEHVLDFGLVPIRSTPYTTNPISFAVFTVHKRQSVFLWAYVHMYYIFIFSV